MAREKKPPVKAGAGTPPDVAASSDAEVTAFLDEVRAMTPKGPATARGRLIFAMDATMSRQPTWDMALSLQADMFHMVEQVGGLDVQLVYFRGMGECRASKWVSHPQALARLMTAVACRGGFTQIGKVLAHARHEADRGKVDAMVYVGDCMEEDIDALADSAGRLGLLGVRVFLFQEGRDPAAEAAFREIARLTHGAYCGFDAGSAAQLRALLEAVATYAAGGFGALADLGRKSVSGEARLLLEQLD